MSAFITFFPVGNGDMILVELDNKQRILIDINIRAAADDEDDDTRDVAKDLRERLDRDDDGRLFVDAMLLSHPDADHVTGLEKHFHLGPPGEWTEKDDKILINEMWSSPIVFRRASKDHVLCDDAEAWCAEARRRVQEFKDRGFDTEAGDRIQILGKDIDGKTDKIMDIVVELDGLVTQVDRGEEGYFEARLLAPLKAENDEEEETLSKNDSSVILNFSLASGGHKDKGRFLTGGDAGCAIWDRLWSKHKKSNADWLKYDIMETPHHCSWRSLSYDKWSELGEKVKVDPNARAALSQMRDGAVIVASCNPIKKEEPNPPHERAKREYISMLDDDADRFMCVGELPNEQNPQPLEFEITSSGPEKRRKSAKAAAVAALGIGGISTHARAHGRR